MSRFPRPDYDALRLYRVDRPPIAVDLSDNTNLWGMHPDAQAVVSSAPPETYVRYPTLYADDLRAQVGRMFGVDPTAVTTGCGSDDVLDSAIRAGCRPPGTLCYAAPTFVMADQCARMNGLDTRRVDWSEALADPATLLAGDPAVVYLCTPNNPTGAPLEADWVERFMDLAGPDGPLVILDEAYADFHGRTLIPLAMRRGRTLVVRTLSKLYGLAGARVGYGVGDPGVVEAVEKSRGPYKVSAIAEQAAVAALRDESGWAGRVLREVRENRERLASELRDRGADVLPSVTNFLLVSTGGRAVAEVVGALRSRGVAVRGFPDQPGLGDAIRVTVGPWNLMEAFLDAFDGAAP